MKNLFHRAIRKARIKLCYCAVNARRFYTGVTNKAKDPQTKQFRGNGFIQTETKGLAEYLADYVNNPEKLESDGAGEFTVLTRNEYGIKSIAIDSNADFLHQFVFTRKLYDLLRAYYGREFYLRNNPTLEFNYPGETTDAQKFHLDWGLRQVSAMFNLIEIDKASTHMEYLEGANRYYYFSQPSRDDPSEIKRIRKIQKKCKVATTLGSRDTVNLFDAGCGYHRQVAGGPRAVLHLNFVDNLAFTHWDPYWEPPNNWKYWFARKGPASDTVLSKSPLPASFFSLVYRKCHAAFGTPRIYCAQVNE